MYHQSSLALGVAILFTHISSTLNTQTFATPFIYTYLFCYGVYALQILPIASLVSQKYNKIIAMAVQLTYIMIQDRKTVKKQGFFTNIA